MNHFLILCFSVFTLVTSMAVNSSASLIIHHSSFIMKSLNAGSVYL
jgi:hypothetical protein